MKLSLNISRAKHTEKHNDRSMYYSYTSDFQKENHRKNSIFKGPWISEVGEKRGLNFGELETLYYNHRFKNLLKRQNENARKNYKKEKTIKEFKEKNMPYEMILQIGDKDEQLTEDEYSIIYYDMLKYVNKTFRKHNIDLINAAVHYDEATPHIHIRFLGIDKNGKPNMTGALRESNVLTPIQILCKEANINDEEYQFKKGKRKYYKFPDEILKDFKKKRPDLFDKKGKVKIKSDTQINTFTNEMLRKGLEDLIESRGIQLDKTRKKRKHLSIEEYKRMKNQEEIENLEKIQETQRHKKYILEETIRKNREIIKNIDKEKKELKESLQNRKINMNESIVLTQLQDEQGNKINTNFVDDYMNSLENKVQGIQFNKSAEEKITHMVREIARLKNQIDSMIERPVIDKEKTERKIQNRVNVEKEYRIDNIKDFNKKIDDYEIDF